MFKNGDVIDNKYHVRNLCSNQGGFGTILHVESVLQKYPFPIVLKYCKISNPDARARFVREIRYLESFSGNSMVLQVLGANLSYDPPYFIMKFFEEGDLTRFSDRIQNDITFQEYIFNKMLDCISELHLRNVLHRDIKPQNFLIDGSNVIVADFGLAKDTGAGTTITLSDQALGTPGFYPPEFRTGGFREPTPPSDIFMLGKTFYSLLRGGADPTYMTDFGIKPAIFNVIERCCEVDPIRRYQSIAELKQDLKLSYDVILGRAKGLGEAKQILYQIINRLNAESKYDSNQVIKFLDLLFKLKEDEKDSLFQELPLKFYLVLAQKPIESRLDKFLEQYGDFSKDAVNLWSYAEIVAINMKAIFDHSASVIHRAKALDIAIIGAINANRFAAMDTCKNMIMSVVSPDLGAAVASVIAKHRGSFVTEIEVSNCKERAIRDALLVTKS